MINLDFSTNLGNDPFARYKRHKIIVKHEGKKTILLNLDQLSKDLDRDEKTIGSFLAKSLGTRFKLNSKLKKSILSGNFNSEQIDDLIQKFVEIDILCKTCGNPETDASTKKCKACGAHNKCD